MLRGASPMIERSCEDLPDLFLGEMISVGGELFQFAYVMVEHSESYERILIDLL